MCRAAPTFGPWTVRTHLRCSRRWCGPSSSSPRRCEHHDEAGPDPARRRLLRLDAGPEPPRAASRPARSPARSSRSRSSPCLRPARDDSVALGTPPARPGAALARSAGRHVRTARGARQPRPSSSPGPRPAAGRLAAAVAAAVGRRRRRGRRGPVVGLTLGFLVAAPGCRSIASRRPVAAAALAVAGAPAGREPSRRVPSRAGRRGRSRSAEPPWPPSAAEAVDRAVSRGGRHLRHPRGRCSRPRPRRGRLAVGPAAGHPADVRHQAAGHPHGAHHRPRRPGIWTLRAATPPTAPWWPRPPTARPDVRRGHRARRAVGS